MNPRVATFAAGILIGLVTAQALGLLGWGGAPSVISPCPIWLVVPIFAGVPPVVAVAAFAALFWVWCLPLFRGASAVPIRTYILWGIVALLSGIWIIAGWDYGLKYEGSGYTTVCALLSAAFLFVTGFLLWRARATPTFSAALVSQALLFAWLGSYALPYLGETP